MASDAIASLGKVVSETAPQIDERLGEQYGDYARQAAESVASAADTLDSKDVDQLMTEARDFGPGRHPGEFVFVPRSAAGAEDDGWLIGLVVDMTNETSELVILNADDFTGALQAVIHLPHRIPPGFHGNWVAD